MCHVTDLWSQLRSLDTISHRGSQYRAAVLPIIHDLARETGVSKHVIARTIREERIEPVSERSAP